MTTTSTETRTAWAEPSGNELLFLLLGSAMLGLLLALPTWAGTRWEAFHSAVLLAAFVGLASARVGWPVLGSALGCMLGLIVLSLTAHGAVPLEGRGADLGAARGVSPTLVATLLWAVVGAVVGTMIGLVLRDLSRQPPEVLRPITFDYPAPPPDETDGLEPIDRAD